MKKIMLFVFAALFVLYSSSSFACVGKTLIIGSLTTPNEKLLAQLMAVIINERTGTTVNVKYFDSQDELYEAIKKNEVNILSENTGRAIKVLGIDVSGDADSIYATVKKEYKDKLQLVMLKPFGQSPDTSGEKLYVDVPIVDAGILMDYPALPRVLNKLAGISQKNNYSKLVASVESGDKPNQVARDFLKKKRFI